MKSRVVKVATPMPPDASRDWIKGTVQENIEKSIIRAHAMGGVLGELKVLIVVEQEVLTKD